MNICPHAATQSYINTLLVDFFLCISLDSYLPSDTESLLGVVAAESAESVSVIELTS